MGTNANQVSLTATLTRADNQLQIHYSIHNGHSKPILVFNRLWCGAARREADEQHIYRFVVGRTLQMLLGAAPLPRDPVTRRNLPEVTKIDALTSFADELTIPVPVTEHNFYYSHSGTTERIEEEVDQVELFVQYINAEGIELKASQIYPGAWRTATAAAMSNHQTLRSGPSMLRLKVFRQTGEYSRLILPQNRSNTPKGR